MNDDMLREIASFIHEKTRYPLRKITPETTLQFEIGCDGDDAVDFMDEFSKRFNVDLSSLKWDLYFCSEGWPGCSSLLFFPWALGSACRLVLGKHRRTEPKTNAITVEDLLQAAREHRWLKK